MVFKAQLEKGGYLITLTKVITKQTKPKSRKDHKCDVCKMSILKGEVYLYEKIINLNSKWVSERKRHIDCGDPDNLMKIWELDEKIDLKNMINKRMKKENK